MDINTLRRHSCGDNEENHHCHLDEKPWVSAETARRLSCDASLVTVLEDENGKVLNIGRRARTVPASLKKSVFTLKLRFRNRHNKCGLYGAVVVEGDIKLVFGG